MDDIQKELLKEERLYKKLKEKEERLDSDYDAKMEKHIKPILDKLKDVCDQQMECFFRLRQLEIKYYSKK